MSSQPLEPGSFIQAHCTRCKEVLRHTVIALVRGRPVRVKCNTCGGEHAYKESAPSETAPPPSKKGARPTKAGTLEAEWSAQISAAAAKGERGKDYATTGGFRAGDVMNHPAFGLGVVQRLTGPGKVLVLFRDGARTLLCRNPL